MGFLKKAIDFVVRPTHSRTMGILIVFVLLAAVFLTVYVAQQQQQLRQRAASSEACSAIDTIQPCASSNPANTPCYSEGSRCKTGNTIWECQRE